MASTIRRITRAVIRTYTDPRQVAVHVSWVDETGAAGFTTGSERNAHMKALLDRAAREGVQVEREVW